MKKLILILPILIAGYSYLLFGNNQQNLRGSEQDQFVNFTNYSTTTTGITSNSGTSAVFSDDGNYVAYASSTGGGVSVGVKTSTGYTFTNYTTISESGLSSNDCRAVAFDSADNLGVATSAGLDIGAVNDSNVYAFVQITSSTPNGIIGNSGLSVAFDSNDDVAYGAEAGLSIGVEGTNGVYKFENFSNSTDINIAANPITGIAFDSKNNIAISTRGSDAVDAASGGLSFGTKTATSYTFVNYSASSTESGIKSNIGTAVAIDTSDDSIAYTSTTGGISIGNIDGSVYTFRQLSPTGVTWNSGEGVAFDKDGDLAYVSSSSDTTVTSTGLSLGVKTGTGAAATFAFTHYSATTTSGITSNVGSSVAFDPLNNFLAYVSNGGALSIGTQTLNATLDSSNDEYSENDNTPANVNVEDVVISLSATIAGVVNNNYDTFMEISVIANKNQPYAFIEYITKDGTIAPGNLDENDSSYQQKTVVAANASINANKYVDLPNLVSGGGGFEQQTHLLFNVKYGQDQDTLTEALPSNTDNSVTTPTATVPENGKYDPGTFSPARANYIYNEDSKKYKLQGTTTNPLSIGFQSAINTFVTAQIGFLQIVVNDRQKLETTEYFQSVLYVTYNGTAPSSNNAIPTENLGSIVPKTIVAPAESTINSFIVDNLTPDTTYSLGITLGLSQNARNDLITTGSQSSISFSTPIAPFPSPAPASGLKNNQSVIIGGVVGGVAAFSVIGFGIYYFVSRSPKKLA